MSGPIGIFDSGVGGLSVAREIRERLPHERMIYFADTANCPYGGRPLEEIRELSLVAATELVGRGAKMVVVACNSASGAALESLRETLEVPVVGMEPAVKPAAAATVAGTVGVMATAATLQTERFGRLTRDHARDVRVVTQACPGLVELVEAGELEGDRVRAALDPIVRRLREEGVDSVVLGCTHYPFLRPAIEAEFGPEVRIIDSGAAVARQVERVLSERGELSDDGEGNLELLTTGSPHVVGAIAERLWAAPIRSYVQVANRGASRGAGSST